MRILFADSDTGVFERLGSELSRERPGWQLKFVQSGQEALAELDSAPFDALLTAMNTAVIDGPELLARTRERHPQVVRLCLPGDLQDEAFLRAMPVAHQFLSTPCRADTVLEVIERACTLRSILHDTATRELIGKLKALPAAPQTFQALSAAIARPNAHVSDITGIVSKDTALAIKTLQIVNSAFFRRSAPIMSIQAAVTYAGLEMLKSLALCACVFDALDEAPAAGKLLVDLQARSLRKAHLARLLLGESRFAAEAFTAALMLDIGQAVLALGDPEKFERMVASARSQQLAWHQIEAEFFGAAHPAVGACLLGLWGLPLELVEAVAYHHSPSHAQHAQIHVLAAVHVADAMVESGVDESRKLLLQLDAKFIARPEVQRCLRDWHIDESTDVRSAERALAL
jgi:HD-like signal output (HDOD) protein/CheY-like chemotaxis protein